MKDYLDNVFEMPDKMVALAVRFLEQGNGKFPERAKNKELQELSAEEAIQIEHKYQDTFGIKSS